MIMLGGMHTEMALWNTLGDVLEGSGWTAALTQADVASSGTADSYLKATHQKPATGRPYVRAFSLSGTVPAFTCDCLRFVCAFTPRPKVDLCVSTSSRTMLAFENNVSFSSSECSTLASCRR